MSTEAIKALDRIAHFEAVQIVQTAAQIAGRRGAQVQECVNEAFSYWREEITEDDHESGLVPRTERALANLGLPLLR